MRLWRLDTGDPVDTPERGYMLRGPPTCTAWTEGPDDGRIILAFGTGMGYLIFWCVDRLKVSTIISIEAQLTCPQAKCVELYSKRVAFGNEITCVCWKVTEESTLQLASGTRDRCIQLWTFNGKELRSIFSIQLQVTVPKNIAFVDNETTNDYLYVFGTYNGLWWVYVSHAVIDDMKPPDQAYHSRNRRENYELE
jgi:hypothetical protein